jgi:hypothetical protein
MTVLILPLIAVLSTRAVPAGDDQGLKTIVFGVS